MVARRGSDGKQDSEAAAISYLSPSHRLQSAVAEALADRAGSYNETKPSDRDGVVGSIVRSDPGVVALPVGDLTQTRPYRGLAGWPILRRVAE